ncbi:MAG: RTX toxin, partial [Hyphomicrobium sp.]
MDIPQGAVIVDAYVQFQVDEVSTGLATLQIQGEDVDNTAAFANTANDVTSRLATATTATVTWSPNEWLTVGEAGVDQQTNEISAIIQEIV